MGELHKRQCWRSIKIGRLLNLIFKTGLGATIRQRVVPKKPNFLGPYLAELLNFDWHGSFLYGVGPTLLQQIFSNSSKSGVKLDVPFALRLDYKQPRIFLRETKIIFRLSPCIASPRGSKFLRALECVLRFTFPKCDVHKAPFNSNF